MSRPGHARSPGFPGDGPGSELAARARRAEALVRELPPARELPIGLEVARALLATGRYQPHRGIHAGEHYRAELGEGCYHLRVDWERGRAWLHRDRWDPRRHALRHFFEVPELYVPGMLALGVGVVLVTASLESEE